MKLRRTPEDFQVEELTGFCPSAGPFALYRLTKRSLGTPEAVAAIARRWRIARRRISYGGLKDRHAVTTQYLTIRYGPRRSLRETGFDLEFLGEAPRPFRAADISGNRFQIAMRDLDAGQVRDALRAAEEVRREGLANYFDDQRFGSLGESGEWIARAWCLGDWERALWLALAEPHPDDRAGEKRQKQILRELWGRWSQCQQQLGRSHRRSIVTYLADRERAGKPPDFRGALARISVDLRGLYLSAYQSALWNRMLALWLERRIDSARRLPFSLHSGRCWFFRGLSDAELAEVHALELPLPSARHRAAAEVAAQTESTADAQAFRLMAEVLAGEGLELRQLRVKYPRDSFFSKGRRRAAVRAGELQAAAEEDELYPGRRKLLLSFTLPRGSYATVLIKRLTHG